MAGPRLRIRTARSAAARTARQLAYILFAFPSGLAWFVGTVVGLSLGFGMAVIGVGLPILAVTLMAWMAAVEVERRLAGVLLGVTIPRAARLPRPRRLRWRELGTWLNSLMTWKGVAFLLAKLPAGVAGIVVVGLSAAVPLFFLTLPIRLVVDGPELPVLVVIALSVVALAAGVGTAVLFGTIVDHLARLWGRFALFMLGAGPHEVRDALADDLGDSSLTIAYWLPEYGFWVDADGRAVRLPEPGSGRSYTEVDLEGHRVAALVHDDALTAQPELVRSAATAAALGLENERLKAELRAQVEAVRASRSRLVQVGDAERRRLERDLHDGAQQRLVALSLQLRLARRQVADDTVAAAAIDTSLAELSGALEELRELARGIHPAVLTDRGLRPALEALTGRLPLPVDLEAPAERYAPAVEATVYFVVAEALTNVAKYAGATRASVRVARVGGELVAEVVDDGCGGADPAAGSGLRGLSDRVAAVDGRLEVSSRPGAGTTVRAVVPASPVTAVR